MSIGYLEPFYSIIIRENLKTRMTNLSKTFDRNSQNLDQKGKIHSAFNFTTDVSHIKYSRCIVAIVTAIDRASGPCSDLKCHSQVVTFSESHSRVYGNYP